MNEFTTMYQYFKGISEASTTLTVELKQAEAKENHHLPPTEEHVDDNEDEPCPNHYLEMKCTNESDSNNNDIIDHNINAVANLSYLNVDNESDFESESFDTVDGCSMEMQPIIMKRDSKDLLNNLNNMKIKEEDEKEITNELKITEENYYDSNEFNKTTVSVSSTMTTDDFSNVCSDTLENVSQTGTVSLTQSTNSIPSSNSDNQQQSLLYGDYLIQPSNRPVTDAFSDYLVQPSNLPVLEHNYMNQTNDSESNGESSHLRFYFKKKSEKTPNNQSKVRDYPSSPTKSTRSMNTLKRNDSDASSKKSVDDELVEIINDFKNNVFTIQEVEVLVNDWKNRNDVKKSFDEKQDQLQRMREEYEKIQQKMKEHLKRPSPFERMKRIFMRKQEKSTVDFSLPINLTGNPNFSMLPNTSQRPNSTLSLHSASSSTSSSGRMSTSSQVSGNDRDSGTHSDHEDRRNHPNHLKVGQPGSLMLENYLIPPAPRPILTPITTNMDEKTSLLSFSSSQNVTPSSAEIANEHYIIFPSNISIFSPPPSSSSKKLTSENNTFTTFKGNNNKF